MDTQQHRRRGRRFGFFCVEQRVPLGLHCLDLLEKQFEPIEFSTNLGFEMLGQATAIASLERIQPRSSIATQRLIPGWRQHVHEGKRAQHGKPQSAVRDDQPDAREGDAGRSWVAERLVVPLKPGNAEGGNRQQGVSSARCLRGDAVAPVVALQAQSQATKGRELSTLAPLRALRARTPEPAWARRAVDEGVRSCPRAGCGRSARPVR